MRAPDPNGDTAPSRLARRLGVFDAVVIGLGAMLGAGVFVAVAPAAQAAGSGLLLGLVLAAAVAWCNATSSAQLAARYPESGGAYVYGRERLGPLWGFLAGWGFVVGKLASGAAMALAFAHYAAPAYARPLAVAAVVALTIVDYHGIQKTVLLTRAIVATVLLALALVVVAALGGGTLEPARLLPDERLSAHGVLQAAGILFFAFAGYARLATLGEEVVDPRRTLPRAIPLALGITLVVYATVAVVALSAIGAPALAAATAPLRAVVEVGRLPWVSPVVRAGAAVASLGVLLSLIVGVSRTTFAMAARGDLPRALAVVHPVHRVPHRAELLVGAIVAVAAAMADLRTAIGFSSFAVLHYYAIANAAAWTLPAHERRWPRWLAGAGVGGCLLLAVSLPPVSVVGGAGVLLLGVLVHGLRTWRRRRRR